MALEEKSQDNKISKEMITEIDLILLNFFRFDYNKVKQLNPLRKKDSYTSSNYGENKNKWEEYP